MTNVVDWTKIRPYKNWILAKSDPRAKQTPGGIFLTEELTGIEKVSVETATVLKVGSTVRDKCGYGLEPGQRFCFRGFLKDATIYQFKKADDGSAVFLIKSDDVLAVVHAETRIGVFA